MGIHYFLFMGLLLACPMDIYYSQEEVAEGFEIGKFFAIIALVIID